MTLPARGYLIKMNIKSIIKRVFQHDFKKNYKALPFSDLAIDKNFILLKTN